MRRRISSAAKPNIPKEAVAGSGTSSPETCKSVMVAAIPAPLPKVDVSTTLKMTP